MSCGCDKVASAVRTVGKGVVGLTISALGPTATEEVIAERTLKCDGCKDKVWEGRRAVCRRCKCWLVALRRIREPQCEEFDR